MLDLSAPVVISEAGRYVLDRDWSLGGLGPHVTLVEITADNVTLDMQGFELAGDSRLIWITGDLVTVRNGRLSVTGNFVPFPFEGVLRGGLIGGGRAMLIEAMRITGSVHLVGGGSVLANSFISGGVEVERGVTARNNLVTSREGSEWAVRASWGAYVLDNQLTCDGLTCVTIVGGGSVVSKNVITSTGTAIKIVNAFSNQVLDNVVLVRTHAAAANNGPLREPFFVYRSGEVAIDVAAPGGEHHSRQFC